MSNIKILIWTCLILLFVPFICSGQSQLKLDKVTSMSKNFSPDNYLQLNNRLVFTAFDSIHDRELWVLDLSNGNVSILSDIVPNGSLSSLFYKVVGNNLFFTADDGIHGNELWVTDGTSSGTRMVKDINTVVSNDINKPSNGNSGIYQVVTLNNEIYFYANDYYHGVELWKSDGTENGTVLIRDNYPVQFDLQHATEYRRVTYSYNDAIYFVENDSIHGWELWKTDGTEQGTYMLKDINPNGSSFPNSFYEYDGMLFFSAGDDRGRELWVSDGTSNGTRLFANINDDSSSEPSSNPMHFIEFGEELYFSTNNENVVGDYALYKVNVQTDTVEFIVKNISDKPPTAETWCSEFNNRLYFSGFDYSHGEELWRSDGTFQGTLIIKDINPHMEDSLFSLPASSHPRDFFVFEDRLFFSAGDGSALGGQLWMTDETEENVIMVDPQLGYILTDAIVESSNVIVGNYCYFSADYDGTGQQIWKMYDPAKVVGLEEGFKQSSGIKLYPNPVGESATLEITLDQQNEVSIAVFDISGRAVYAQTQEGIIGLNQINILTDNFTNGIYVLEVSSGTQSYTMKMIR